MFMKKYSFQSTVINFNEDDDEGDWQSVMAKCLGARHLAMLPQIPDITMSDAGEPSGIFSSMEDPEIGRDMGSISNAFSSPILPKTIIEKIPDSPPFLPAQESPISPVRETRPSPAHASPISPVRETRPSLTLAPLASQPDSPPFSPAQESPISQVRETRRSSTLRPLASQPNSPPFSPAQESPISPVRETRRSSTLRPLASQPNSPPFSPAQESPISPVRETRPSPAHESLASQPQPQPSTISQPQPSAAFPQLSPKRPKRFLKGKRCEKWRGQHPIYKPLENGCFEVLGLTHAKTPDIIKRKVNKVKKETKKTNVSESFRGRSASTRSKNENILKSFENLQWKKTKGSDAIEIASLFRDKSNGLASGFFRMNGVCEKPSQKTAGYKTIFTLLKGSVAVKIAEDPFMVLNEYESIIIPELTCYGIKNLSECESILYYNVYQH